MTRTLLVVLILALVSTSALAADAAKVLVAPFAEISDGPKRDWVGRAIQESLIAELSRLPIVTPISAKPDAATIDDVDQATAAATDAGAQFIVFGSYQLVEQELRVTGQTIDAASGEVLGGIKATGNLRDLFGVEDIVASQVKRALTNKLAPSTQPTDALAERTTVEPSGPVRAEPRAGGRFDGSELEQSLASDRPFVGAPPQPFDDERERYRYSAPPFTPYGWSPYGYGYGPRYRYTPRYIYGYDYSPRIIVVPRRSPVRVTVPTFREPNVPNGNYNRGQGNTMQGGPGNTMTGRGPSGNTMTGGSGNTNSAGSR